MIVNRKHFVMRFDGKVVLITGGSSGIGLGVASALAGLGARVAIAGRNPSSLDNAATELNSSGAKVLQIPMDVRDPLSVQEGVKNTVRALGRLDIVLACAGVSMRARFEECKMDAIRNLFETNFFGVVHLLQETLPELKKSQGSFVGISSLTGKRGVPGYSIYGASKFALQGLLDSVRMEVQKDQVHIGVVSTGFVDTPLRDKVLGGDGKVLEKSPELPFRLWPLEKCVHVVMRLIRDRQREAFLPWFMRPFLAFDVINSGRAGDKFLREKFGL